MRKANQTKAIYRLSDWKALTAAHRYEFLIYMLPAANMSEVPHIQPCKFTLHE